MLTLLIYSLAVTVAAFVVLCLVVLARKILYKPSPAARGLFIYSDGVNTRAIDPITAMMGLKAHKTFILDRHLKLAYEGDSEAIQLTAQAARDVFTVPAFTTPGKPGLTVTECYRLIWAFCEFCAALKKNTNPLSTAPMPTDATLPESSEATPSDTMPFGSVENEQQPEAVKRSTTAY